MIRTALASAKRDAIAAHHGSRRTTSGPTARSSRTPSGSRTTRPAAERRFQRQAFMVRRAQCRKTPPRRTHRRDHPVAARADQMLEGVFVAGGASAHAWYRPVRAPGAATGVHSCAAGTRGARRPARSQGLSKRLATHAGQRRRRGGKEGSARLATPAARAPLVCIARLRHERGQCVRDRCRRALSSACKWIEARVSHCHLRMDAFQSTRRSAAKMPLQVFFCSAQLQHWSISVLLLLSLRPTFLLAAGKTLASKPP